MERLTIPAEFKMDDGAEGLITGLGSTFGNVDLHGDVIEEGAFAESIDAFMSGGRHIAMLDHHRMDSPIGKWVSIRETDRGLEMQGRLTLEVQRAKELRALARDGALGGLSIGFRTLADRYDRERQVRIIEKVELLETSLVSMPANPKARIESVKLAPEIETVRDFERALVEQLGFSRNAAKSIAAGGFKGDVRDAPPETTPDNLRDAVAGLKALSQRLTTP